MRTPKSGVISTNTTWTAAGGPYVIVGDVGVASQATLTLEPGVRVEYSEGVSLIVKGTLIANGTPANRIVFASHCNPPPTRVKGVLFESSVLGNSQLSHVRFEDLGVGLQVGDETEFIQVPVKNSGTLRVTNAEFVRTAVRTKGYSTGAGLVLDQGVFTATTIVGLYPRSEPITLRNAELTGSTVWSDSYNYGVTLINSRMDGGALRLGCCGANFTIEDAGITGAPLSGVDGTITVRRSTFTSSPIDAPAARMTAEDSVFTGGMGGALIRVNSGTISFSSIKGNAQGIGLEVTGNGGLNVSFTEFAGNGVGLKLTGAGAASIQRSNLTGSGTFALENRRAASASANTNYWGTTNSSVIDQLIFDENDAVTSGRVNYTPFLLAPEPLAGPR